MNAPKRPSAEDRSCIHITLFEERKISLLTGAAAAMTAIAGASLAAAGAADTLLAVFPGLVHIASRQAQDQDDDGDDDVICNTHRLNLF